MVKVVKVHFYFYFFPSIGLNLRQFYRAGYKLTA